ncbi:hypothetical protein [Streptomyces meridianus]|uniref:Integral membrane protein n=1 Tax=Streptomyces meridianus TaxID=2938945 RepID=A0ABT0X7N1_9ACTN|nr:hypothetical protein [Streptomyces meridianus]MCM2578429.1 hypothetical protein [Streptomyces meridianus]
MILASRSRGSSDVQTSLRLASATLAAWPPSRWAAAGLGALLTALVVGIPTDVVPNPLFSRSVPVQWWNYPVLALTAVPAGLVLATYVRRPAGGETEPALSKAGSVGGVLSFLAVGCPVCNKLVLLLLGTSGALTIWAPLQPFVALASVVLMAFAAVRRLSTEAACPARPSA